MAGYFYYEFYNDLITIYGPAGNPNIAFTSWRAFVTRIRSGTVYMRGWPVGRFGWVRRKGRGTTCTTKMRKDRPKPSSVCRTRRSYLLPVMLDDFVSSGHEEEKGDESRG